MPTPSKANTLAIVGARLSSTRLPGKHLQPLAGKPLIERVIQRLRRVPEIDSIFLATTIEEVNQPLREWANKTGVDCFSYAGDTEDVVGRVDRLVRKLNPEYVVYVCGDSPLIHPPAISRLIQLLRSHREFDFVDFVPPPGEPRYIHEGFDVFSRRLWNQIAAKSITPQHREHVGAVFKQGVLTEVPTLEVREKPIFNRIEHRLSVDTEADLNFMKKLYSEWYEEHEDTTIVPLEWVIERLIKNPELRKINRHVKQRTADRRAGRISIVTQSGPDIGLGHLRRAASLSLALQERHGAAVRLNVVGDKIDLPWLQRLPITWHDWRHPLDVDALIKTDSPDCIIIDWKPSCEPSGWRLLLDEAKTRTIKMVAIGHVPSTPEQFAAIIVPSFEVNAALRERAGECLYYGFDYYLVTRPHPQTGSQSTSGPRVLIMTGGSDAGHYGVHLPSQLAQALPQGTHIDWIQGPLAATPELPKHSGQHWHLHYNPSNLPELMQTATAALCVYGISAIELLANGTPTVLLPLKKEMLPELFTFSQENLALVATDSACGARMLADLLGEEKQQLALSRNARARIDGLGPARAAAVVAHLIESGPRLSKRDACL